ncbi:hypothetical protein N9059_00650 [bacterium]|nr:hypothetical protein [bacterium]
MQHLDFDEVLDSVIKKDPRYHRDAYYFIREALEHTQRAMAKSRKDEIRHVSGQEILQGIRDFSVTTYGPMTTTLFTEWGIKVCEDFGEVVYNLIDSKILAKNEGDSKEDFAALYTFEEAFVVPFLPKSKLPKKKRIRRKKKSESGETSN